MHVAVSGWLLGAHSGANRRLCELLRHTAPLLVFSFLFGLGLAAQQDRGPVVAARRLASGRACLARSRPRAARRTLQCSS